MGLPLNPLIKQAFSSEKGDWQGLQQLCLKPGTACSKQLMVSHNAGTGRNTNGVSGQQV